MGSHGGGAYTTDMLLLTAFSPVEFFTNSQKDLAGAAGWDSVSLLSKPRP